jgi:glycosyltransferase involved in cell wall biosynthesis
VRILFLSTIGRIGGAEASLIDIISVLRAGRPDWRLNVIAGSAGPMIARLEAMNVDVEVLKMPEVMAELGDHGLGETVAASRLSTNVICAVPEIASYCVALRRRVRRYRPCLVHSNGFKMHVLSMPAALGLCPVVWHLHDFVSSRPLMSHVLGAFANRVAGCIANSESVAADANRILRLKRPPARIYNAINFETFTPSGRALDLDTLAGLPPATAGTVRIGLVGTFARWKGHQIFLQALARLRASVPVRGYIIGGPVYQTTGSQYSPAELQAMALELGLAGRVGFTGYVDTPAAAMRALDIVVHASTRPEPFGLSIVEAMACGLPVVAANAGGVEEIVNTGGALGVPLGRPDELAHSLQSLIETPQRRLDLVQRARGAAEKLCSPLRLQHEITEYYEGVAA